MGNNQPSTPGFKDLHFHFHFINSYGWGTPKSQEPYSSVLVDSPTTDDNISTRPYSFSVILSKNLTYVYRKTLNIYYNSIYLFGTERKPNKGKLVKSHVQSLSL